MSTIDTSKRVSAYLKAHRDKLELLERMWSDPLVRCYNDPDMPHEEELAHGSLFLAGPTSRHQILEYNWRCEAVAQLREAGFNGIIYIPEPRGLENAEDFTERGFVHGWESSRLVGQWTKEKLSSAKNPVFWVPRKADEMLGLNTNLEWGIIIGLMIAGKVAPEDVFVGWPEEAERMGLPRHYNVELAACKRYDSIRRLAYATTGKIPPEDISDPRDDIPF